MNQKQWQANVDRMLIIIDHHQHAILEQNELLIELLQDKDNARIAEITNKLKAAKDALNASVSAAVNVANS